MRIITTLFVILLVIIGAFFAALNAQPVAVNYLLGSVELPLAVVVFAAFALGILLTALFLGFRVLWLKHRNKRLNAKLQAFEVKNDQQVQQSLVRDIK